MLQGALSFQGPMFKCLGRRDSRTRIQSAAHPPVCIGVLNASTDYLVRITGAKNAPPPSLGPPRSAALALGQCTFQAGPMQHFVQDRSKSAQDGLKTL